MDRLLHQLEHQSLSRIVIVVGSVSYTHLFEQIWTAFTGGLSTWFYNRDQTIKYNALCVTVLLFLCFRQMKKKHQRMPVFFMIVGGMLLEITFLSYIGRVMARLIDLMLLIMLVMGCLTFIEMLPERRHTMKDLIRSFRADKIHGLFCVISYAALTAFMLSLIHI